MVLSPCPATAAAFSLAWEKRWSGGEEKKRRKRKKMKRKMGKLKRNEKIVKNYK